MLTGAVARLAGVTVRALHHYDEVELRRMSDAVALAMEAHQLDIPLAPEERLEVFGPFDRDEHAAEAHERWGDADAYRESARRTATFEAIAPGLAQYLQDAIVANAARHAG